MPIPVSPQNSTSPLKLNKKANIHFCEFEEFDDNEIKIMKNRSIINKNVETDLDTLPKEIKANLEMHSKETETDKPINLETTKINEDALLEQVGATKRRILEKAEANVNMIVKENEENEMKVSKNQGSINSPLKTFRDNLSQKDLNCAVNSLKYEQDSNISTASDKQNLANRNSLELPTFLAMQPLSEDCSKVNNTEDYSQITPERGNCDDATDNSNSTPKKNCASTSVNLQGCVENEIENLGQIKAVSKVIETSNLNIKNISDNTEEKELISNYLNVKEKIESYAEKLNSNGESPNHSFTSKDTDQNKPLFKPDDVRNLKLINVYDSQIFESFCIDDDYSIKDQNGSNKDSELIKAHLSIEMSNSSQDSLNNKPPSQHSDFSSSCYISKENPNYGMILSSGEYELSNSLNEIKIGTNIEETNSNTSLDCEVSQSSNLDSSLSKRNTKSASPSPKKMLFNDTLEEMEMLLNNGIEYFDNPSSSFKSPAKDNQQIELSDGTGQDDSVVGPEKEGTISSSNSIHSFNPNLDSTHASLLTHNKDVKKAEKEQNLSVDKASNSLLNDKVPSDHFLQEGSNESISKQEKFLPSEDISLNSPPKIITKSKIPSLQKQKLPILKSNFSSARNPIGTSNNIKCSSQTKLTAIKPAQNALGTAKKANNFNWKTPSPRPLSKRPPKTPSSVKQSPHYAFIPEIKISEPGEKHKSITKTPQSMKKGRQMPIISPVAKYLQDNPPPPLIATVKPRHKISPCKLLEEVGSPYSKSPGEKINLNQSSIKREVAITKNEDSLKRLAHKVTVKVILRGWQFIHIFKFTFAFPFAYIKLRASSVY